MNKNFLILATLLAALAVILGAFGAHGLKKIAGPDTVATFQTGVQYQMYHAIGLFIVGILYEKFANSYLQYAGILFVAGIILFSGSLYLLAALKASNKVGLGGIGIITPIGGLCFIAGWLLLMSGILKK
jgi:uncharacterized membrane protein YgdD (TMEM256/DUF423 family)